MIKCRQNINETHKSKHHWYFKDEKLSALWQPVKLALTTQSSHDALWWQQTTQEDAATTTWHHRSPLRYRKHQVTITAHDRWWSRRRTSGGTRKQTYSWCIVTNTRLTSSDRRGHHMRVLKSTCMQRACAITNRQKDTLTYTEVLHDKLSQDPLHGWEESKVRLKEKRERKYWSDVRNT